MSSAGAPEAEGGADASWLRPGEHLHCRCGWVPTGGGASRRRAQAARHWRTCQGEPPGSDLVRLASARQLYAGQALRARREQRLAAWCSFVDGLEPELSRHCCVVAPESVAFREIPPLWVYNCSKCGVARSLANFRQNPCKETPNRTLNGREFRIRATGDEDLRRKMNERDRLRMEVQRRAAGAKCVPGRKRSGQAGSAARVVNKRRRAGAAAKSAAAGA